MNMEFRFSPPARVLTIVLLLQALAYYAVASRSERIPSVGPLSAFPSMSGDWVTAKDYPIEKEVQEVLKADDTLNRIYTKAGTGASLFVAFFRTQRYGQTPHSPKYCLPGSGWQPIQDRTVPLTIPGRSEPLLVNEYFISRGDQESVVLYWYQSHSRVIAREISAKFWLVADAVRYHRSDTALVRVIAPVLNQQRDAAEHTAMDLARSVYPDLVRQLPR
jgi:EpsI family protein